MKYIAILIIFNLVFQKQALKSTACIKNLHEVREILPSEKQQMMEYSRNRYKIGSTEFRAVFPESGDTVWIALDEDIRTLSSISNPQITRLDCQLIEVTLIDRIRYVATEVKKCNGTNTQHLKLSELVSLSTLLQKSKTTQTVPKQNNRFFPFISQNALQYLYGITPNTSPSK